MSILRIHKLRLLKVKVIEQRQEMQEPKVFPRIYCGRNEDVLRVEIHEALYTGLLGKTWKHFKLRGMSSAKKAPGNT